MYHLKYILLGDFIKYHRVFRYKEDMDLYIKRLNPTVEIETWEE